MMLFRFAYVKHFVIYTSAKGAVETKFTDLVLLCSNFVCGWCENYMLSTVI